ncbi:MAG: hypothetical protein EU541_04030, partial [Promethearchaeota archaeon]
MKKESLLIGTVISFLFIQLILSIPIGEANSSIPAGYSDEIQMKGVYVYNISSFGEPSSWYNYEKQSIVSWKTDAGGQIKINFTGFYDRHENDTYGDAFPDNNMPYFDIEVYEQTGILNFTRNNCSNAEASSSLMLGYWPFNSGFLIPENVSYIKNLAEETSQTSNFDYIVEESYNFLYFNLADSSELIYDKMTGLLIYAKTNMGTYNIEMSLTNYSLDLSRIYQYNVSDFGNKPAWWYVFSDKGYFETSEGGLININFTGYYNRSSSDWGDVFPDTNMAYMNVDIFNKPDGELSLNFTQVNVSNKEVAVAMILGYNNFQSGFLVPSINNITKFKMLALQEASGFTMGEVEILETSLTLKIKFEESSGGQKNYLLYEKKTGLLLWCKSIGSNYRLEITINGYDPWSRESDGDSSGLNLEPYIPYIIIGSLSIASILGTLAISKYNLKVKELNKYIIIVIIIVGSFSSLIYFQATYSPDTINEKQ